MKKIITLFAASVLLTAVFSYSLQEFVAGSFIIFSLKTMLIPCFTWSILLISAYYYLPAQQRMKYFLIAGWVCAAGSAVLVPAGIYNFISAHPDLQVSVTSVLICVVLMSFLFYLLLTKEKISLKWWFGFNVLIVINMVLFYLAAKS